MAKKKITPKAKTKTETIKVSTPKEKALTEPVKASQSIVSVQCVLPFYDLQAKCNRDVGAQFEVDSERADALKKLGLVIVL